MIFGRARPSAPVQAADRRRRVADYGRRPPGLLNRPRRNLPARRSRSVRQEATEWRVPDGERISVSRRSRDGGWRDAEDEQRGCYEAKHIDRVVDGIGHRAVGVESGRGHAPYLRGRRRVGGPGVLGVRGCSALPKLACLRRVHFQPVRAWSSTASGGSHAPSLVRPCPARPRCPRGYAAGAQAVRAQSEAFPFPVGQTVAFGWRRQ